MMIREELASSIGGINPSRSMTTCQIIKARQPGTTVSPEPPSYPRK